MGNIGIIAIGDEAASYYMREMTRIIAKTSNTTGLTFIYPGEQDSLCALVEKNWSKLEERMEALEYDLRARGCDRVALATNMLTLRRVEPTIAISYKRNDWELNSSASNIPTFISFWDSVAAELVEASAKHVLILGEKADMFDSSIEKALAPYGIEVFPMDSYEEEAEKVDGVIKDLRNDIIEAEAVELVINLANQLKVDAVVLAQPILEMVTVPDLIECTVVNAAKAHIERILSAS